MGFAAKKLGGQDPFWSEELTVAAAVYGTAAHMQIIRYLRANGPSTRHEVAHCTGLSFGLAAQCLNRLKSAGVVTTPLEEQNARTYAIETARARYLFHALECYLNIGLEDRRDASGFAGVLPLHGGLRRQTG
ncbi:winged helix-turn-helix transcriptional regulator [Arthrobacter sp. NPDC093128]|uniref:winged helix-turn-helix domain-containing protein n=1 Tax=Arthrobacter sp. NPDC093128 TaxID=3154979 RepID=UPI003438E044